MAEDIVTAIDVATAAFERPALALLHRRHAPAIVAALRTIYGPNPRPVDVDEVHVLLESLRKRLAEVGRDDQFPAGETGRDWCRAWVNSGWLRRDTPTGSDTEVYMLTAAAREAIAYVERVTELRAAGLSESRIRTILEAARRAALEATPDAAARIAALDEQIAELTRERDRIAAGGTVAPATEERMLETYLDIADLLHGLPADFQRVAETESRGRRDLITRFRQSDRGAGDVLTEYLQEADRILTSSPEGRAFLGAVELLQSDEAMEALRGDLHRILDHGFAAALSAAEQREFRTAVDRLGSSLDVVQYERHRTSATIHRFVGERSAADRAAITESLERALLAAEEWAQVNGRSTPLPAAAVPTGQDWAPRLDFANLRMRLHPLGSDAEPEPLHCDVGGPDGPSAVATRAELLALGGPHMRSLRGVFRQLLDSDPVAQSWTLGEVFAAADESDRRPVDFIGLVGLAANANALPDRMYGPRQTITARRPDGTTRDFSVPVLVIDRAAARSIVGTGTTTDPDLTPVPEEEAR